MLVFILISLHHYNVTHIIPIHVCYFTPIFVSDSWGCKTKVLA